QAAQRCWYDLSSQSEKIDLHHNWGLRSIEVDLDSLGNYRFVARSLTARLRDGSVISVPADGVLPAVELKAAFEREPRLTVYLALPLVNLARANVSANGTAETARYLLDSQDIPDENTGTNPQPVRIRLLNLKLLLSTDDLAGYETVPVARIEKSASA